MDILDLILCVVGANRNSEIVGRTQLQKNVYFVCEKLDMDCGFTPHYYGPYSRAVEDAVDTLVSVGFLSETEEDLFHQNSPDVHASRYTYRLTKSGDQVLEKFKSTTPTVARKIEEVMSIIDKMGFSANSRGISTAAKTYCILKQEGKISDRGLTPREISGKARSFNWRISEVRIEKVVDLLFELGLAKRKGN